MDPWLIALMYGLPSILSLFGGGGSQQQTQEQESTTVTEQTDPKHKSPVVPLLAPALTEGLLSNFELFSGAGMPGGMGGLDSSWMEGLLQLLKEEWPETLEEYQKEPKEEKKERPAYNMPSRTRRGRL